MRLKASYPLLLFLAFAVAFDQTGHILLLLLAAALHELGHIAAILLCGGKIEGIYASLSGLNIGYISPPRQSYGKDMLMALSGPLMNALAALITHLSPWQSGPLGYYFIGTNALLCLFNLLPALPLDGGRVLLSLLMMLFEGAVVVRVLDFFSITVFCSLCLYGLYAAIAHLNFSFLIVGLYLILCFLRRKRFTALAMDDKM